MKTEPIELSGFGTKLKTPVYSYQFLDECFYYKPDSGALIWKVRPTSHFKDLQEYNTFNNTNSEKMAGCIKLLGWTKVQINKTKYPVRRIIWVLVTGKDRLDRLHRAKNKSIEKTTKQKTNTKLKGATFDKASGKYKTFIQIDGNQIAIGGFDTAQEAHDMYCKKAIEHYGEFANFGYPIE
jgi:hypothetical protein